MNIFCKLTLEILKKNKVRTIVTIIGIILSAAMISAVTTLVSVVRQYAIDEIKYINGSWHGMVENADEHDLDYIRNSDEVEKAVYSSDIGYALIDDVKVSKRPYFYFMAVSEGFEELMPVHVQEGRYPENENEILIDSSYIYFTDHEYSVGDTLEVEIGKRMIGDIELHSNTSLKEDADGNLREKFVPSETKKYVISGFFNTFNGNNSDFGAGVLVIVPDNNSSNDMNICFTMKNPDDIYDFPLSEFRTNYELLAVLGIFRYNSYTQSVYGLAGVIILLIGAASVSLIYNAFSISVSERIKMLGLLSSVGATRKQLRNSVFFEAAVVSSMGIPAGILLGITGITITLKLIINNIGGYIFEDMKIVISPLSIFTAVCISLVIVFISAFIPANKANKMNIIDAVRQTESIKVKNKAVKIPKFIYKLFGISGMIACKQYKINARRYRATVISLFMSVVLFISASAFTSYLSVSAENSISVRGYNMKFQMGNFDEKHFNKVLNTIRESEYTEDYVYCLIYGMDVEIDRKYLSIEGDFEAYNIYATVYFVEDEKFKQFAEKNNAEISAFFDTSAPVAIAYDKVTEFYMEEEKYKTIYYLNGDDCEYKTDNMVLKSVKTVRDVPFYIYSDSGHISLIYPYSMYKYVYEYVNNPEIMIVSSDHNKSMEELSEVAGTKDYINDYSEADESEKKLILVLKIFCYGFIVLMSLVAAANVFNTITTNINIRRREFAMLKSVGMTPLQFSRMLRFECILYGSKSLIYGLPVSAVIIYFIYFNVGRMYEIRYFIPVSAVLIAVFSIFAVVSASMLYSMSKIKKENTIDALKNENV